MRPGRHAADDASFAKSTGAAAGRGILLLAVAAIIGILLYQGVDDVPPGARVAAGDRPAAGTSGDEDDDDDGEPVATTAPLVTTTTVALRAPKDVKVLVANGTTTGGLGGRIAERLRRPAGYNTLAPTNAKAVPATIVYATAGYEREAVEVAKVLGLTAAVVKPLPTPSPVPDLRTANVLVIAGPDIAGAAPAGSTTTMAKGTTATTARGATTSTTAKR